MILALTKWLYQVAANDEWALIGVALGFPVFPGGDGVQPGRCAPIVGQRLQQLYNAVLRQFDQAYISSIVARIRAASQAPQPQSQPHQPTEADYQAFLASISSESPALTPEAMSILPRFSHTSGANLEAHRVPQHVIAFVERNRENLQRAAQYQSGFRADVTSTKNAPQDHQAQSNEVSGPQMMVRLPQDIPGYQEHPERLHPTLSSWLNNMDKLSGLIDRLEELACAAPSDYRPQLDKQVAALRKTYKSQRERCIQFLQLTGEYADRYLLDISAEIQQQSSFLEMLQRRLEMAETLYYQAIDLRKSYETGTVNVMKDACKTGKPPFFTLLRDLVLTRRISALSQPLPEDFDLLDEVDSVLREIRRCYEDLDKFWIEEIRRAVKALEIRCVDPGDVERWRSFKASLEKTIESWKAWPHAFFSLQKTHVIA